MSTVRRGIVRPMIVEEGNPRRRSRWPRPEAGTDSEAAAPVRAPRRRWRRANGNGHGHSHHGQPPIMEAHGWGGLIALYADRVEIRRVGFLHVLMDVLPLHIPRVDSSIFLDTITAIEVVRPLTMIEFVRFAYAGDPGSHATHGGYWASAFADNAVMMNLLDNRGFYRLIEAANALRRGLPLPDSTIPQG